MNRSLYSVRSSLINLNIKEKNFVTVKVILNIICKILKL